MAFPPLKYFPILLAYPIYALIAWCGAWDKSVEPLPHLNIEPNSITISGLSSGAHFTAQFQVAFSKTITGAGIFAGYPWHCDVTKFSKDVPVPKREHPEKPFCDGCRPNETVLADHCQGSDKVIEVDVLVEKARRYAAAGRIDDVEHLQNKKVYTYDGVTEHHEGYATKKTREFFEKFGADVLANFTTPGGHGWPQASGINPCGDPGRWWMGAWFSGSPWAVENCGYDGPGAMLQHFYGLLSRQNNHREAPGPLNPPADAVVRSSVLLFDQAPFGDVHKTGLDKPGMVYVPASCAAGAQCKLHISLHGGHEPWVFEYELVQGSKSHGLSINRWAETNKMVVLWPKVGHKSDYFKLRQNNWDSYGETGDDFDTKTGVQMVALRKMIETIAGINMADV